MAAFLGEDHERLGDAIELFVLILALFLLLIAFDDRVGDVIPGIVDADEEEQDGSRCDDKERWRWSDWEHNRCDDECCVSDERKSDMPDPVF